MTKYIGKKIIVSLAVLLAAGFVLYFLAFRFPTEPGGIILPDKGTGVLYGDDMYIYRSDDDGKYFSLQYFIPVEVASLSGNHILYLTPQLSEDDFNGKYYISPFTRHHILYRDGKGGSRLLTLHSIESIS
ncbi:MAG: hypothetical protein IJN37_00545 [Clostridia bacterium]|nr:hypothetical protein [Clostridia bacterium]